MQQQYSYAPCFLGFQLYWSDGIKHLRIPYWFILSLLVLMTIVVWRKTRGRLAGRGFPVEVVPQNTPQSGVATHASSTNFTN